MVEQAHEVGLVGELLFRHALAHELQRDVHLIALLVHRLGEEHLGHASLAES